MTDEAADPLRRARRRGGWWIALPGRRRGRLGRGPRTQAVAGSGVALQAAPGQWPWAQLTASPSALAPGRRC